jgi:hypothetical protein
VDLFIECKRFFRSEAEGEFRGPSKVAIFRHPAQNGAINALQSVWNVALTHGDQEDRWAI